MSETKTPRWAIESLGEAVYDAGHYPIVLPAEPGIPDESECSTCSDAFEGGVAWPCAVARLLPEDSRAYVEMLGRQHYPPAQAAVVAAGTVGEGQ